MGHRGHRAVSAPLPSGLVTALATLPPLLLVSGCGPACAGCGAAVQGWWAGRRLPGAREPGGGRVRVRHWGCLCEGRHVCTVHARGVWRRAALGQSQLWSHVQSDTEQERGSDARWSGQSKAPSTPRGICPRSRLCTGIVCTVAVCVATERVFRVACGGGGSVLVCRGQESSVLEGDWGLRVGVVGEGRVRPSSPVPVPAQRRVPLGQEGQCVRPRSLRVDLCFSRARPGSVGRERGAGVHQAHPLPAHPLLERREREQVPEGLLLQVPW